MKLLYVLTVLAVVACLAGSSDADIVVYGTHTDHPIVPGGDLTDIKMTVDLAVSGGVAIMTFKNTSDGDEISAVFKEIVLDTHDDDLLVGGEVLWNPVILTHTDEVSFSWGDSNGLPGYNAVTTETTLLIEFQADSPPTQKGINIGESLQVQFQTSLADSPDAIGDYLSFFNGGDDTADYCVGFHAISASTVDGESLSGIYEVPEPATMGLIGFASLLIITRRKRV